MEMGTHDYSEAQRAQARQATEASLAAVRRDNIPTLGELIAASDMVLTPEGHLMPRRVADRGARGWDGPEGAAADRDSGEAARLAMLVKHMDEAVSTWLADPDQGIDEAEDICRTWQSIREITQGRTSVPTDQPDTEGS